MKTPEDKLGKLRRCRRAALIPNVIKFPVKTEAVSTGEWDYLIAANHCDTRGGGGSRKQNKVGVP